MHLGDSGENDLVTWLDIQISEWVSHVSQEAEVSVLDWLSWALKDAVSMVDLEILYDSVVVDCQLRPLDVLLNLLAELFKVPVRV